MSERCAASQSSEIGSIISYVSAGVLYSVSPCRILGSCTDLMQAIKELILSSKDLQRDIVESGRVSAAASFPSTVLTFGNEAERLTRRL